MSDSTNKTLLTIAIIIGIIILIVWALPRTVRTGYSYYTPLSASVTPVNRVPVRTYPYSDSNYDYEVIRYVPHTTRTIRTTPSTTRSYSYTTTPTYSYEYYPEDDTYYPEGCNATTRYSATTGDRC